MADKSVNQLNVLAGPIQDSDKVVISRDGIEVTSTDVATLKSHVLNALLISSTQLQDGSVATAKLQDNSITTPKIANDSVTYAKIQNVTAGRLLGRGSDSGNGDIQEIPVNITSSGELTLNQVNSPDIRSENYLRDVSGSEYHGCVQIVSKVITAQYSQSLVPGGDILVGLGSVDPFQITFTPRLSGSFVKLTIRWFGEMSVAWDAVFNIHRNSTRVITSNVPNAGLSMATQTYGAANDANSTPEILNLITLDKAPTTAGVPITYRLMVSVSGSQTMWTNRTFNGTGEFGSSEIIIEEYAQ